VKTESGTMAGPHECFHALNIIEVLSRAVAESTAEPGEGRKHQTKRAKLAEKRAQLAEYSFTLTPRLNSSWRG
jgi:hypothetical protein